MKITSRRERVLAYVLLVVHAPYVLAIVCLIFLRKVIGVEFGYKLKFKLKTDYLVAALSEQMKVSSLDMLLFVITGANEKTRDTMLAIIDPNQPVWYTPKSQRLATIADNQKFKVKLRFPTVKTITAIKDGMYDVQGLGKDRKERIRSGTSELLVLQECLLDWVNAVRVVRDSDGNPKLDSNGDTIFEPVPFDTKNKVDMLEYLPENERTEIYNYLRGESELDEEKAQS